MRCGVPATGVSNVARVGVVLRKLGSQLTSCLVYQLDLHTNISKNWQLIRANSVTGTYMSMTAPGKKGASTNPKKNRAITSPAKDLLAA